MKFKMRKKYGQLKNLDFVIHLIENMMISNRLVLVYI